MVIITAAQVLLLWTSCILLTIAIAALKNRDTLGWGVAAVIVPPFALLLAIVVEPEPLWEVNLGDPANDAYKASLAAGSTPAVALKDSKASMDRFNAQNVTRKRYTSDAVETVGKK